METHTFCRRTFRDRERRPSTIAIPNGVSPIVKLVFAEMARQRVTYDEVAAGSGVLRSTLKAWRHKNRPSLDALEAVLGFLGWDFVPVPREKRLPAEVLQALRPAVDATGLTMPVAVQALVEIVADIHVDLKAHTADAPTVRLH
ncbi:MAG: hypothetical protein K2X24_21230 [Methylobacterium sp.]|nr:hypothetical protein [Methylobacterium sp.]